MYGAGGWVGHVYTDAWGFTAPGAGLGWGPFVTGGIWAASHLWEQTSAAIRNAAGGKAIVRHGDRTVSLGLKPGVAVRLDGRLDVNRT